MNSQNTQALYDWSACDARVKELGYRSFRAWCVQHGFSPKTGQALRRGEVLWRLGPKMQAVVDQAVKDGLATITAEVFAA